MNAATSHKTNASIDSGTVNVELSATREGLRAWMKSLPRPKTPDPDDKMATLIYKLSKLRGHCPIEDELRAKFLNEYENKYNGPDIIEINNKIYELIDDPKVYCASAMESFDRYPVRYGADETVKYTDQDAIRLLLREIHSLYPLDQALTEVVNMTKTPD